jgi:hypothetical protein
VGVDEVLQWRCGEEGAQADARAGDADGQPNAARKPASDQCNAGHPAHDGHADGREHAVTEVELPERRELAAAQEGEAGEERSAVYQRARPEAVGQAAGDGGARGVRQNVDGEGARGVGARPAELAHQGDEE